MTWYWLWFSATIGNLMFSKKKQTKMFFHFVFQVTSFPLSWKIQCLQQDLNVTKRIKDLDPANQSPEDNYKTWKLKCNLFCSFTEHEKKNVKILNLWRRSNRHWKSKKIVKTDFEWEEIFFRGQFTRRQTMIELFNPLSCVVLISGRLNFG